MTATSDRHTRLDHIVFSAGQDKVQGVVVKEDNETEAA